MRKRKATEKTISFTVILEKINGWALITAIVESDRSTSGIAVLRERVREHPSDRFEYFDSVTRADLDEWLTSESFATIMEINGGHYRGHQIGYFDDIDGYFQKHGGTFYIPRCQPLLRHLDELLPLCGDEYKDQ